MNEDSALWRNIEFVKRVKQILRLREKERKAGKKPKGENWRKILFGKQC